MLRQRNRLRRVLVRQRVRGAEDRRRPPGVDLQRHLIRLQRLAVFVLLEEEIAPGRLNGDVVGRAARRIAVRRVGLVEASERAKRAGGARHLDRIVAAVGERRHLLEQGVRVGAAERLLQQAELQRRFTRREAPRHRPQQRFGLRVPSARDQRSCPEGDDVRIATVQLLRRRLDLVVPAFVEGANRGAIRRVGLRRPAGRLRRAVRGEDQERERGDQKGVRDPGRHR